MGTAVKLGDNARVMELAGMCIGKGWIFEQYLVLFPLYRAHQYQAVIDEADNILSTFVGIDWKGNNKVETFCWTLWFKWRSLVALGPTRRAEAITTAQQLVTEWPGMAHAADARRWLIQEGITP